MQDYKYVPIDKFGKAMQVRTKFHLILNLPRLCAYGRVRERSTVL